MYYNLDKLPITILKEGKAIDFLYNKKEYFFKVVPYDEMLKELVAEKIANRFGVACCHYFPAIFRGVKGVVSESAYGIWDVTYKTMNDYYIEKKYLTTISSLNKYNNLEDIWNTIYYDTNIPSSVEKRIMDEVTDIFIFDALIGNIDRHGENFGIIPNGKESRMAPIFDNNRMLSSYAINNGKYNLAVSSGETPISTPGNFLYIFLDLSDKSYLERFKVGLDTISEESLKEIFQELESEGIVLVPNEVIKILEGFRQNREMLNNYFNSERKRQI